MSCPQHSRAGTMDPSSTTRPARAREEREELLEGGGRAKRAPRLLEAPEGTRVFEKRPPHELFCPICSEILSEASSPTHCGHWFCKRCLEEHLRENGGSCPVCRSKCETGRTVCQHVVQAQISELKIHCRYGLVQSPGGEWVSAEAGARNKCSEVFTMDSFAAHEAACPFALVDCGFRGCMKEDAGAAQEVHEQEPMAKHLKLALVKLEESQSCSGARQDEANEETKAEVNVSSRGETAAQLRQIKREVSFLSIPVKGTERKPKVMAQRDCDGCGNAGSRIVSATSDRCIRVWSMDGRCLMTFKGHRGRISSVAVLHGGDRIVSASEDGTLKIWSLEDGRCNRTLKGHQGSVLSMAVLPGDDRIVSASEDCTLKIWSLTDGSCERTLKGHEGWIWSVVVMPGGDKVVSASEDGTLKAWSLEDGRCQRTLKGHEEGIRSVVVLPGGDKVVSASDDKTLKVWSLADGRCKLTLKGHRRKVVSMAVLPGTDRVVTTSTDSTLKIWSLANRRCERTLTGHHRGVWSVAVLPGGDRVISASDDKTLKVWSLADGRCERTLQGRTGRVRCVEVVPCVE